MTDTISTRELIDEFLDLENQKKQIDEAATAQKKHLSEEQKPIKQSLRCKNRNQVMIYKMILDANPGTEVLPQEFADIINYWTEVAIMHGVDEKCAKKFGCPEVFAKEIVEKVAQHFNINLDF